MIRARWGDGRLLAALAFSIAAIVQAAPLTLAELDQMPLALACRDVCAAQPAIDRATCLSACLYPVDAAWEKNGVAPVDRNDWMLAILEYWDEGSRTAACAADAGVVLPIAECAQGECRVVHPEDGGCEDSDKDGLLGWEEALIGTDPQAKQTACASNAQCDFATQCDFKFELGRGYCLKPRACKDGPGLGCTAFHLEKVACNMQEVILHVSYDYSPTPATVLDLRVLYSATDLVLLDARPLPLLNKANKGVSVTYPAVGVLRLVVLGEASMDPIPTGPIVELVFQRVTPRATTVRFDPTDIYQRNAMAPSQGAAQASLAQDSLWGSGDGISVGGADAQGPRLVLAYSFDSLTRPLEYIDVPDPKRLCALMSSSQCPTDTPLAYSKTLASLGLLQGGGLSAKTLIPGVIGSAAYFDGTWDHLDLPTLLNEQGTTQDAKPLPPASTDQSSSVSMWVLPEGRSPDESAKDFFQVLWSHQHADETSRYAIRLSMNAADPSTVDLGWFDDGKVKPNEVTPFAVGLPLHKWVHLGMTLDATTGDVQLLVDGTLTLKTKLATLPLTTCPAIDQGQIALPGGDSRLSDAIYLSTPENGLFGIDRMEPSGAGLTPVVRTGDATAQDPDYSPSVDKVVYSSNKSGSNEIWVANGDGSNPLQLTTNFGDAASNVLARRPKWSSDAKGIVFESNAFDKDQSVNPSHTYQLYLTPYDPAPGASQRTLDFKALALTKDLQKYAISSGSKNHTNAAWTKAGSTGSLGTIVYNVSDSLYRQFSVVHLTLPASLEGPAAAATEEPVKVSALASAFDSSTRVLSAEGPALLLQTSGTFFDVASEYSLETMSEAIDPRSNNLVTVVRVLYNPPPGGQPRWPTEIPSLYLAHDGVVSADLAGAMPGSAFPSPLAPESAVEFLDVEFTSTVKSQRFVRIAINSTSSTPIQPGAELAVLRFQTPAPAGAPHTIPSPALALELLRVERQVFYMDESGGPLPLAVPSNLLEIVNEAALSPRSTLQRQVLFSGINRSRPILVAAQIASGGTSQYVLKGEQVIGISATRTEGLSWTRMPRFTACNQVGAWREPSQQLYQHGFRGALDELKIYSYVRDLKAFRSDSERGHDWLRAARRDGILEPIQPTCTGRDTECPPYMVCNRTRLMCERMPCVPTTEDSCVDDAGVPHGLCSLRPLGVKDETSDAGWLCSSDCNVDSQCFQRDCLNGPCRFCTQGACNECQVVEKTYGGDAGFTVKETVGCPDSNKWACEYGNCVSQCYSNENGISKYLCNPTGEYCERGRCVPMKWDWSELGPSSLSGLGEMRLNTPPLTYLTVTSQTMPIEIKAYGVEDYVHPPELLVEGRVKGEQAFLAQWFEIGRVLVYNRTAAEAESSIYKLITPYPVTELRLRLVVPPLQNFAGRSSGLGLSGENPEMPSGSQYVVGYELGIPMWKAYEACDKGPTDRWGACQGKLGVEVERKYLRGGQPAVVIKEVLVANSSPIPNSTKSPNSIVNRICSYEGTPDQSDLGLPPKRVLYGRGQTVAYTGNSYLLNCNYFDAQNSGESAGLEMAFNSPDFKPPSGVNDGPNVCTFGVIPQQKACYEIADGDASLDVFNPGLGDPIGPHGLLELELFRFFAWPMPPKK